MPAVDVADLAEAWSGARRVVALTGAGMSTASGIPDFRSPGGRWSTYQPVTIQAFMSDQAARVEYWRYKGETWQVISEASANPAHVALKELADAERLDLLVTQNIDGLHERSGFPPERLINIHGTDAEVECMSCHRREPRAFAQKIWASGISVPRCSCGGAWKPATVSFGQSLPAEGLQRAMREVSRADLFVAAGTSLQVGPINQMFLVARAAHARTAILTASETPFDSLADWKIDEPLEEVLPRVRDGVLAASPRS